MKNAKIQLGRQTGWSENMFGFFTYCSLTLIKREDYKCIYLFLNSLCICWMLDQQPFEGENLLSLILTLLSLSFRKRLN